MKRIEDEIEIIPRKLLNDDRGWFLKTIDGYETSNTFPCEVYLTSAKPGESRGGHYHEKAKEWFTLIQGEALLTLCNIKTGEAIDIYLNGKQPKTIYVPEFIAHIFRNRYDEDFLLLAYTDIRYDPLDTFDFKL